MTQVQLQPQADHPTEAAYRRWVERIGAPMTPEQEVVLREILRRARLLDQLHRGTLAKKVQVDQRSQLLRELRNLSGHLRNSLYEEKIRRVAVRT